MKWENIPPPIQGEFLDYFDPIHDAEEEEMAPGTDECDGIDECFAKIGPERMAEIYNEFLNQAPFWVRQLAFDVPEEEDY